jgi:hypothetical protein
MGPYSSEAYVVIVVMVGYFRRAVDLYIAQKCGVELGYSLWNSSRDQVLPFMAKLGGVCQLDITCPLLH